MREAKRRLASAQNSLSIGEFKVVSSLCYYAMFHAATALLAARGIFRRRHLGLISALSVEFVKTGDMEDKFGAWLRKSYDARTACDYEPEYVETRERAEGWLERTREFLRAAEERLKRELAEEAP
jgi:uncharacterized protein (UPF0332 family)